MDDAPVPEIAVSRTSSQASSKKGSQASDSARKRPSVPKVKTDHTFHPYWKPNQVSVPSWKRFHDANPEWHLKWDQDCFNNGRVLIIDYKSMEEFSEGGKRHVTVASQEMQSLPELKKFYSDPKRIHGAALRVIHVQNATHWAVPFLLRKFNIEHPNELVGMPSFGTWARYKEVRQRNGRPFPNGRSWRAQTDPWRNVSRTAFGMDYVKAFPSCKPNERKFQTFGNRPVKMMHLNAYPDSSNPPGYDVCVQRVSVYMQRKLGVPEQISPELNIKNPYKKYLPNGNTAGEEEKGEETFLEHLDNSNTVILFETSASRKLEDCLVQPRNDFENRWRRLSFYLRKEDVRHDSRLAAQCTNFILTDLFIGLSAVWDHFLSVAGDHVALLEDKIYENPADESRAPELWTNQAAWLRIDKVMWIHSDMVRELQGHLRELADVDDDEDDNAISIDWLASTTADYERLSHSVSDDLIQPTDNLSDLMYKSVGIRDSRQSLQLSLSMWRLSWITFIFLPLTFIVGFFGMNVDLFANNPGIGWYFVAAAILMIFVLGLWYCVKHSLQRSRQTPYQRGLYEALFLDLEDEYPQLWSSTEGAVSDVEPEGFFARAKWHLLRRWFAPDRTINKKLYSSLAPEEQASELGAWAGLKRFLLLRWLPDIDAARRPQHDGDDDLELGETHDPPAGDGGPTHQQQQHQHQQQKYEADTLSELVRASTPIGVADAEPGAAAPLHVYGLRALTPREKRRSRGSRASEEDRPSSRGSSGIMVEERNLSDSESDAGEAMGTTGTTAGGGSREGDGARQGMGTGDSVVVLR